MSQPTPQPTPRPTLQPVPGPFSLDRLRAEDGPPFALLRRRTPGRDGNTVEVLVGEVREVSRLADLPTGDEGRGALALVPFRQIAERGFATRDDGTPLAVLVPDETYELPLQDVLHELPQHRVQVSEGAFDVDDAAYEEIVRRVVTEEIGAGEGANFVIRRNFEGVVHGFSRADALALFRRLLSEEQGAYWTFLVHTGDRVLVGASPEVHVRMSGGTAVMNPISGTYRYPPEGPSTEGLLEFLADRKESEELSMVVDEELKMMSVIGDHGGVVVGPRLREMAHLAHTEYELRGQSSLDVREVLRETMFAATVTGSPVENACRVIKRYEPTGRGYYAGALALLGESDGAQTLDSPILIRTAHIDTADGRLRVPVGATLVRASDPAAEVAETHAKAAGVLTALGVREAPAGGVRPRARLAGDPRVQAALAARRTGLAPFWLRMQEHSAERHGHALVVDAEDTFTSMLAHLLRVCGFGVTVRRYDEPGLREAALAHPGPVVLGPGPGDPRDVADPKMRFLRGLTRELLAGHRQGVLGVCLGHELIAAEMGSAELPFAGSGSGSAGAVPGLELVRKARPYQGAQERIDLFGQPETVGFYNSFTARCDEAAVTELAPLGVELSRDPDSGEVYALRGPGFAGVQFHPESVLTLNGARVTAGLLGRVANVPPGPRHPARTLAALSESPE
ncbi:anthranilate synthase family protein [Streptomyces sp. N2-109]|uniref:anthranilate synthase n=1 Tax=Streptomyces gossypii TaxID=2883101 RepID=A0ABT2JZH7_9ACTN|nr:anthranilate synthase family protein [Streptomyces gossypii]MCT2593323.1 anthranilate synthase family protein [Streptomyces gossypii]